MEAAGVVNLYSRSEEKGLRYIPFIGDGDSKAYTDVCQDQPYGPAVFIPKEECVSHVTKRMGTALRALVKDYKGRKLSDGKGLGGSGRLTVNRIDTFQNFYGNVLRENKGDAKAMSKSTHAILKHYSSTPEEPRHEDCPKGPDSWCSYQTDRAHGTRLHKTIKDPLCPAIVEVVQPIFDRLGNESFLSGCENCMTQNANESLHHIILSMATKDMSNSAVEISTAISLGVLQFNNGATKTYSELIPSLGIELTTSMKVSFEQFDKQRIYQSNYRSSIVTKTHRKKKKKNRVRKNDAFVHAEGTTYKSQAFYDNSKPKKKGAKGKNVSNTTKRGAKGKNESKTTKKGAKGKNASKTTKKGAKGKNASKTTKKNVRSAKTRNANTAEKKNNIS